jgi:hypothetical protein
MIASFNYQNKGAEKVDCPVCKISCYKRGKKTPQKVIWYFPLISHMQRYFTDRKEAKLMS